MPVPSPAGGIWQVRVIGEIDGQETVNVLHFSTPVPVDDIDLRLILVLANCFITHMVPVWPTNFTLKEIRYQMVSTNPPGLEYTHTVAGGTGTGPAAALPSFASAVVSLRTNVGGRSGRGRMFVPGIPEAATSNSLFDTGNAYWTGLVAFLACVVAAFVGGDPPPANTPRWVVYSKKLGGATFPYSVAGATPVVTATARTIVGTTNSRKLGHGA